MYLEFMTTCTILWQQCNLEKVIRHIIQPKGTQKKLSSDTFILRGGGIVKAILKPTDAIEYLIPIRDQGPGTCRHFFICTYKAPKYYVGKV